MPRADADPLRRFERDAGIACAAMMLLAFAARRGNPDVALGVLAGGLLMFASYRAVRGGVDAVLQAVGKAAGASEIGGGPLAAGGEIAAHDRATRPDAGPSARRFSLSRRAFIVASFLARYALLALGAYAMLVRLRLSPVGLLAGVSSPVVAAAAEAVRAGRALAPRRKSR